MYHPFALVRFDGTDRTYIYENKHRLSLHVGDRVIVPAARPRGGGVYEAEVTVTAVGRRQDLSPEYAGPCRSIKSIVTPVPIQAPAPAFVQCPVVNVEGIANHGQSGHYVAYAPNLEDVLAVGSTVEICRHLPSGHIERLMGSVIGYEARRRDALPHWIVSQASIESAMNERDLVACATVTFDSRRDGNLLGSRFILGEWDPPLEIGARVCVQENSQSYTAWGSITGFCTLIQVAASNLGRVVGIEVDSPVAPGGVRITQVPLSGSGAPVRKSRPSKPKAKGPPIEPTKTKRRML